MAVCPECYSEKSWISPRCPHCNQYIGSWATIWWNLWTGVLQLIMFVGAIWLFFSIFG